jgi:hypothetical protein
MAVRHSNMAFVIIVYFTFTSRFGLLCGQTQIRKSSSGFGLDRAFMQTEKSVVLLSLRVEDYPKLKVEGEMKRVLQEPETVKLLISSCLRNL